MGRRNCCGPVIRRPKNRFFPHGGNKNSEKQWNDPENPLNLRRFHGTDPLEDGFDPGENPCSDHPTRHPRPDIPI
jgi:hypothetical protein